MTRRNLAAFAALSAAAPARAEVPPALRDLRLPADLLAAAGERAQRAIEEARWLEELPLEGVAPGFVFPAEPV